MASKNVTSNGEDAPRRDEFADFALVLKDGREIKCHKIKLAKASPFFCRMLRNGCVETQTNTMQVTEFEPATVEAFLDYIYAELELVPDQDMFKKNFDKKRMTPDLLKMSHMYEVTTLHGECVKHLAENVQDGNAVEIWTVAETFGYAELKKKALGHIMEKGDQMLEVPGVKESNQLLVSLVTLMSDRMSPVPDDAITIKVVHIKQGVLGAVLGELGYINMKPTDTVTDLRLKTDMVVAQKYELPWSCQEGSFSFGGILLEENRSLESCNLRNGSLVACLLE